MKLSHKRFRQVGSSPKTWHNPIKWCVWFAAWMLKVEGRPYGNTQTFFAVVCKFHATFCGLHLIYSRRLIALRCFDGPEFVCARASTTTTDVVESSRKTRAFGIFCINFILIVISLSTGAINFQCEHNPSHIHCQMAKQTCCFVVGYIFFATQNPRTHINSLFLFNFFLSLCFHNVWPKNYIIVSPL